MSDSAVQAEALALWAGVEATVNRVGNKYSDQIERSGHALRISDLDRLASRRLGIRPIVGLLHHGSRPPYTNLLDPEFPEKLAQFAGVVAQRFRWVEDYFQVSEAR